MPSIQPELFNRDFRSTTPSDLADPPTFGQINETAKDVFLQSLRRFFQRSQETNQRLGEVPTIEKFNTVATGDPFETVLTVIRKYPDLLEKLPHVAILNTSGKERALTIGPPLIGQVQFPPQIVATLPEPYALTDGDHLDIYTSPGLKVGDPQVVSHTSTLTFTADRFPTGNPIGAALAVDVARVINEQALYVQASVVTITGQNFVQIATGGSFGSGTPNAIEVAYTSSASVLSAFGLGRSGVGATASFSGTPTTDDPTITFVSTNLAATSADVGRYLNITGSTTSFRNDGRWLITAVNSATSIDVMNRFGIAEAFTGTWFIGLRDDSRNAARPPANRYGYCWDTTVEIHVLANDDITRDEVSDLVSSYLSFFLEEQYFTFLGRSVTDPTIIAENFQITLERNMTHSGGTEIVRGESPKDKIFVDAFSVPCVISLYVDRNVLVPSGPHAGEPWIVTGDNVEEDETLPLPT